MVSPRLETSLTLEDQELPAAKASGVLRNYGFHLLAALLGIALAFM